MPVLYGNYSIRRTLFQLSNSNMGGIEIGAVSGACAKGWAGALSPSLQSVFCCFVDTRAYPVNFPTNSTWRIQVVSATPVWFDGFESISARTSAGVR